MSKHHPPHPKLSDVDLKAEIKDKAEFDRRINERSLELLLIEREIHRRGLRAVIAFEGWDAGGKGGSIRRLTEPLDPRGYVVHPIGAPTPEEKAQFYLHRFWTKMPRPGSIAIFDRTWYGRVLVERVEGYCDKDAWKRAYGEINAFEKMLADDGVAVIKFFLHISSEEQLRRFLERQNDPFKSWKLTDDDWKNREKRPQYKEAIDDMFRETHTEAAPWVAVASEHKWYGRLEVIDHTVKTFSEAFNIDIKLPKDWKLEPR